MIESIIRYSVNNKLIIGALVVSLMIWGLLSLSKLSIDAVPDITNNQVQILTTTRNLSTLDVEQFISYPIEMEMANLPGVKEIRSTNKFGLSVVTVVFKEEMGTYLPRQLIEEKLKTAREKIPEGFGNPEMGPISTGLGEIVQYVVDVKPGFEDKYSDMDLRTIQDWIIKRQLSGIEGVVEINTWGGHLKQYEIAVDPMRLKSMKVSLDEIIKAIQTNNSITGAGYVEKNSQTYFIRAEGLLRSMDDIKKVVIKNDHGKPIFIEDVATVQYGHAPRFGAITGNGEGEKVMGQVMLLKGANTKVVLERVNTRIEEIQSTLPEGVYINPFLERSELLSKTTYTITENLLLGALIVIFVVILLLGNFRSGLIIASLIPLSLLFALGMMNVFGVSANLMSLGAIDFGIIIDGAIIIVEFILFSITGSSQTLKELRGKDYYQKKDEIAIKNSSQMMRSAIFGQIIILIVFLPILTLQGVEGKMFRPMAMTFSFALIGAMILCLTYVPMMAALFIKPSKKPTNFADGIIKFLQRLYDPIIRLILRFRIFVVASTALVLLGTFYIFSNMGGEFVPTLDEGDIVIQPLIASGTSLGKTIELSTMMESLIKEKFEEVDQVVSRIGAAEVPTDPMAIEEVDMIITLKPKSTWKRATTKDGLIEEINTELKQIPGMEYEFTQPIEMRFNELISGARADIAIKIYGEDLDVLYSKATQTKALIDKIDGAADVVVDKVEKIPQVKILFDRNKVAQYGLNIQSLNQTIQMAYAGLNVGELFKGEQRFDIVVRYDEFNRSKLSEIEHVMIDLPSGGQVPISEVADINIIEAPAKIARDDTKRRVSVGVNVRNRDLESVVTDIKQELSKDLNLPPGYHIKYGGQFENLDSARKRLLLVVPIALVLIFLLLYMTFHSIIEAIMIYSAIPLASIGGILLLYFRDMPFSISAGIGFIALFGIAVLNGIVLIEHYKHLSLSDFKNIKDMVIEGTKQRIRPVLLTAAAAALGFLPMAISTSSGAEVQRPLATAVIGGLFTSTLLTLVLLPVFYSWLLEWRRKKSKMKVSKLMLLVPFLYLTMPCNAQQQLSLEEALELAYTNSPSLDARLLGNDKQKSLNSMGYNPGNTSFSYSGDALVKSNPDQVHSFFIAQEFEHPSVLKRKNDFQNTLTAISGIDIELQKAMIERQVRVVYNKTQKTDVLITQYSKVLKEYEKYLSIAQKRNEAGESSALEYLSLKTELDKISLKLQLEKNDHEAHIQVLSLLIGSTTTIRTSDHFELPLPFIAVDTNNLLHLKADLEYEKSGKLHELSKTNKLPKFDLGIGLQNYYESGWFGAFEIGAQVSLFQRNLNKEIQSKRIDMEISKKEKEATDKWIRSESLRLRYTVEKYQAKALYSQQILTETIPEMLRIAALNYKAGSLNYLELVHILNQTISNTEEYFDAILECNIANAELDYLNR